MAWMSKKDTGTEKRLLDVLQFARENGTSSLYRELPLVNGLSLLSTLPKTDADTLRSHTGPLIHYKEDEIRYLVSEFYESDAEKLFLLAQRTDTVWTEVDRELKRHDPIVAVLSVPLFWQIGPMMYRATRENKIPISVLSPRNLPLARQVIKEVGAQFIAATPETARDLLALLLEDGIGEQIQSWHLITPAGHNPEIPKLPGRVVLEHHLFPGVPIGLTSEAMVGRGETTFIPSEEFLFEIEEGGDCFVTSLEKHAVPLIRFKLPGSASTVTNAEGEECIHFMRV
jgi:hypothetical protein